VPFTASPLTFAEHALPGRPSFLQRSLLCNVLDVGKRFDPVRSRVREEISRKKLLSLRTNA